MSAGIKYTGTPYQVEKELYSVKTGYRMIGGYNPSETALSDYAGVELPTLTPLQVDTKNHTFDVVDNIKVIEAAASSATSVKIAKGNICQKGASYLSEDGVVVAVSAIDKTTSDEYDTITCTALSAAIAANSILSKCKEVEKKKAVVKANAAQDATVVKVEKGHGLTGACTLTDGTNDVVVNNIKSYSDYDELEVTALTAALSANDELEEKAKGHKVSFVANKLLYAKTKIEAGCSVSALGKAYEIKEDELYVPVSGADKASLGNLFMFI